MKIFNKSSGAFRFFSSLKLAVFSILNLATVLAIATVLESYYGMRAVHVLVYGTWWFAGCLVLLGSNVLCAALSRYPWKRHQTGFVVTHLGIITLLVGSFVTQQWGVDGNLAVVESTQENDVILNQLELSVVDEKNGTALRYPLRDAALPRSEDWLKVDMGPEQSLVVDRYIPRALPNRRFVDSPIENMGAPAIRLELSNDRFQLAEWIFDQDPGEGANLNLGPASVKFKQLWNEDEEKKFLSGKRGDTKPKQADAPGFVLLSFQGKEYRIEFSEAMKKWYSVSSTGLQVKIERYLPYAVVEKNELVNRANDPVNPTVQLFVRKNGTQEKEAEKHTVFANFPEFTTLHGQHRLGNQSLGVTFKLKLHPASQEALKFVGKNRGELRIAQAPDRSKLYYQVFSAAGELNGKGEVKLGEKTPTGWMNLEFRVSEWLPHAVEDETPRSVEYISGSGDNYLAAIHLSVKESRKTASIKRAGFWLFEGGGRNFSVLGKDYYVHFTKNQLVLPFQIFLEKFTIGMNPGTAKAAAYESDVVVKDPTNGVEKKAKISMNEPLQYGGYTLYQASYQMEEGKPPVSIFSVNKDSGRWLKYLGSLVICLGILLMFYMNPHYWDVLFGREKARGQNA